MAGTRVYIGRLNYNARERDIEHFFRGYGKIRDVVLKNGFGFVEFDDYRDADDAVYEMNGKELCGDRVVLELARRPPKGSDAFRGPEPRGGGGFGGAPPTKYGPPTQTRYRLTVENLSSRISWQDLKDFMRQAGEVSYADAHKIHRNEGVVCFASRRDLDKALDTLDGEELNGRKIKLVDDSKDSKSRSRSRSRSRRKRSRSRSRSRRRSRSGSSRSKSRSRSRSRKSRSRSRDSRSKRKEPKTEDRESGSASPSPKKAKREESSASPSPKKAKREEGSEDEKSRNGSAEPEEKKPKEESKDKDEEEVAKENGIAASPSKGSENGEESKDQTDEKEPEKDASDTKDGSDKDD